LSSSFLSKNVKFKYRTVILPVVLYGCEAWPFTIREKQRLIVFNTRVLRKLLELRERDKRGVEETTYT
jgi:hypothetical protein